MAVPIWVKQAIDTWITAAKIEKDRLLRPLSKSGKMVGDELGDWAIWSVVEQSSKQLGSSTSALMTSAVPAVLKKKFDLFQVSSVLAAKLCATERYLGSEQAIAVAMNDNLGL